MKNRKLPIDPNTLKEFKTVYEWRTWVNLERFIRTGRRATPISLNRKLRAA